MNYRQRSNSCNLIQNSDKEFINYCESDPMLKGTASIILNKVINKKAKQGFDFEKYMIGLFLGKGKLFKVFRFENKKSFEIFATKVI